MNSVMQGLLAAANHDPQLTRVFSTYTASNPSIYLDIDREKAQALGLGMNDVFGALQATLGGIFINNFNLFGRVWQVNIQGEAADRNDVSSLWQIYIRNKYGTDVPLRSIADARVIVGPQVITRYNNYRAIPIQGGPSPARRPARRSRRWRRSREDPTFRIQLRMDRDRLSGGGGFGADRAHPWPRRAVRFSVPGRPLRELDDSCSGAAVGAGRGLGRLSSGF